MDCPKPVPQASNKSCFLYVKLNIKNLSFIGTSLLESVLSCDIQRYWIIGNSHQKPVLKVKILESKLLILLIFGNQNGQLASVWQKIDTPLIHNFATYRNDHHLVLTIVRIIILSLLGFLHGTLGALFQVYHTFNLYYVCLHYLFHLNIGYGLMS